MSRKGEIGSALAVPKSKKRKPDSPLFVAAKRPSTSTLISTQGIKNQHQKKKREVRSKRKRSKEAGRNSSPEERKKDKMNEMKAQVKEMKAFIHDMRTQMDIDRPLLLEDEAIAEEFNAILAQLRDENKRQVSKILCDQLLADYLQFIILSLP